MNKSKEYPRVLVVNHDPFNTERNNGMTMSNLFRGWPKDRLAEIYLSGIAPSFEVCSKYWAITEYGVLLGTLGRSPKTDLEPAVGFVEAPIAIKSKPFLRRTLGQVIRKLDRRLIEPLWEIYFRLPATTSKPMIRWIEEFQPDVIYSMMGTSLMLRLAVIISEKCNVPLVPHFTDDWLTTQYNDCFGSALLRRNMFMWLCRALQRSPIRLAICSAMAKEYSRRYGGVFEPFMNCLDQINFSHHENCHEPSQPLRFIYIGGLHLNRWSSLRDIGEELLKLNSEGLPCELLIYTYPYDIESYQEELTLSPVMRICGWVPNEKVPEVIQNADVLVHVESFDLEIRKYTQFSVSTKIPEYMIAGRCIFAYGPQESASVNYIKESGAGVSVGKRDKETLRKMLFQILTDHDARITYAQNARIFALTHHEAEAQRERFRNSLIRACNEYH